MKSRSLPLPLVLLLCALVFVGCQHVGSQGLDDVNNFLTLKQNIDTKESVYARFGQPADVVYTKGTSGPSTWVYVKSDVHPNGWSYVPYVGVLAGGSNQETTKAFFSFDAAERYTMVHTSKDSHYINGLVGVGQLIAGRSRDQVQRVHDEMDHLGKPFDLKQAKIVGEVR